MLGEAFEDLGSLPNDDYDPDYGGRGKHYVEWLRQMLSGNDPLITLGGLQLAIPRSLRNATVCAEKIESYGMDLDRVANQLGYVGWEDAKKAVEGLPDEGWYVEYYPRIEPEPPEDPDEGRFHDEMMRSII